MKHRLELTFGVMLSSAVVVTAAGAPIGTVKASGDFRLAGANVRGNGTLFAGDTVESNNLRATVRMDGGAEVTLAPHSRGKIFAEKVVLESGSSEMQASNAYVIEAGTLRVNAQAGRATVEYSKDSGAVLVAANEGRVDVHNSRGLLIAQLRNGQALAFQTRSGPQSDNSLTVSRYTGVIRKTANGEYLLTDDATGITIELTGLTSELARSVGKTTMVRGTTMTNAKPANGASAVVSVMSVVDTTTAPAGTTGTNRKKKIGAGAITAVATGGALGGVFGGLAAADAFGGDTSR